MRLTPEQREEGRRLLDAYQSSVAPVSPRVILSLEDWLWEHRNALLADRQEIERSAVREFAERLVSLMRDAGFPSEVLTLFDCAVEAAALGVTLEEKC